MAPNLETSSPQNFAVFHHTTLKAGAAAMARIAALRGKLPPDPATLQKPADTPAPEGPARTPRDPPLTRKWMQLRWPGVFSDYRPLAVDIDREMQAAGLSHTKAKRFLNQYCRSVDYLLALAAPGARRVHLDGTDAGEASTEHQATARQALIDRFGEKMVLAKVGAPGDVQ